MKIPVSNTCSLFRKRLEHPGGDQAFPALQFPPGVCHRWLPRSAADKISRIRHHRNHLVYIVGRRLAPACDEPISLTLTLTNGPHRAISNRDCCESTAWKTAAAIGFRIAAAAATGIHPPTLPPNSRAHSHTLARCSAINAAKDLRPLALC